MLKDFLKGHPRGQSRQRLANLFFRLVLVSLCCVSVFFIITLGWHSLWRFISKGQCICTCDSSPHHPVRRKFSQIVHFPRPRDTPCQISGRYKKASPSERQLHVWLAQGDQGAVNWCEIPLLFWDPQVRKVNGNSS